MTDLHLVTTLVSAFGLALVFGYVAQRYLSMPALVGYVLAGMAVGLVPNLPPVDRAVTAQLSEVGVMLLMFGVGLHFSVRDLLCVKGVALPGALLQMLLSTLLGTGFALTIWDWPAAGAVLFGLTLSCASTVVVTKALEMRSLTNTVDGRVTIGWLIVQDLVTVVVLVLLPPFAQVLSGAAVDGRALLGDVLTTLAGMAVFAFLMLGGGGKLFPFILKRVAMTGSRELFTLAVLALALGIAYFAGEVFKVSFALGAFFAGMVLRESKYARRAAENSLPLQDAFAVLFFVSVGMMLDWHIFIRAPYEIVGVVAVILLGTSCLSAGLVVLLGWPLQTALTVGASLAQIGEFSFIVAGQGIALKMADEHVMSLIVGAAIVTIALNPFVFRLIGPVTNRLVVRWAWARRAAARTAPMTTLPQETPRQWLWGQAVVAGNGELIAPVVMTLLKQGIPVIALTNSEHHLPDGVRTKIGLLRGEPTDAMTLVQAHVTSACVLVLVDDNAVTNKRVAELAREINPNLEVVVRLADVDGLDLFEGVRGVTPVSDSIASAYVLAGVACDTAEEARRKRAVKPVGLPEDEDVEARGKTPRNAFEAVYPEAVRRMREERARASSASEAGGGPQDGAPGH